MKEYAVGDVFEMGGRKYVVVEDDGIHRNCGRKCAFRYGGPECVQLDCHGLWRSDGKMVYYEKYCEPAPIKRMVGEVWRDEHGKLVQHVQTIDGTEADWFPPDEPREGMIFRLEGTFLEIKKRSDGNFCIVKPCPFEFSDIVENGFTMVSHGDIPKEKWVPKKGEPYFCFNGHGNVFETKNADDLADRQRIAIGNYFHSRELCESAVAKVKELLSEVPHE